MQRHSAFGCQFSANHDLLQLLLCRLYLPFLIILHSIPLLADSR